MTKGKLRRILLKGSGVTLSPMEDDDVPVKVSMYFEEGDYVKHFDLEYVTVSGPEVYINIDEADGT